MRDEKLHGLCVRCSNFLISLFSDSSMKSIFVKNLRVEKQIMRSLKQFNIFLNLYVSDHYELEEVLSHGALNMTVLFLCFTI